ncbi:GPW/gp25 family protein [Pseudomonas schmalbachii]|uniref:GPW/gp25 family protein n=1 Tax=Pseudomonas schmalbachii TaxID=2816993 RepID=A0ABS3TNL2_9PSED|nr:GPW/gp25 family protein [Pseudomonas schmalbachii]MBO3274753.1 GPW/gp25 family protein [Pseudomonas schmalbachii]
MALEDPFIGSGWSFPPAFDKKAASVTMSTGIRDIEESLRIIFSTALGERIMNPLFGCALDSSVFEVMNASRISYLENLIRTAIIYHEARIDADQITVEPDQLAGRLLIAIGYKVRGSNSRFNFVYPYYLNEA